MTKPREPEKKPPTLNREPVEFKLESSCHSGFTKDDLESLFTAEELKRFYEWMTGQTRMLCDGKRFIYKREHTDECGHDPLDGYTYKCDYVDGGHYEATSCSGLPDGTHVDADTILSGHGAITYRYDVERYIEGGWKKAIFD